MNSRMNFNTILKSDWFVFITSGVFGILFFIFIFGLRVLDFTYTDWLMNDTDLTQHYLGWRFYRNSDFGFPFGLMEGVIHPFRESIVFADSIPILAVFFRMFSFALPLNFQYFGLFGILSYFLQGAFSGIIIKKLTNNMICSVLGSMFVTGSSFMLFRMFAHTALAAHFIILIAIYICITKNENRNSLKKVLYWGGLLSLGATVHPYFVPMVFAFSFFYFLDDFLQRKKMKTIILFSLSIALCVVTMSIFGVFYNDFSMAGEGLHFFNANINALINPIFGSSTFLRSRPLATGGQYEGMSYIGFGMIILGFVALFSVLEGYNELIIKLRNRLLLQRLIFGVILFFSFFVISLGPVITIGNMTLLSYMRFLPDFIEQTWSTFRATGRFIWPAAYLLMFGIIVTIAKKYKPAVTAVILSITLLIQLVDLTPFFRYRGEYFRNHVVFESSLQSTVWDGIVHDHMYIYFMETSFSTTQYYHIGRLAVYNNIRLNDFHLARKPVDQINFHRERVLSKLRKGYIDTDIAYLFLSLPINLILNGTMVFYEADGIIVGVEHPIDIYNIDNVTHLQTCIVNGASQFFIDLKYFRTHNGTFTYKGLISDGTPSSFLMYGPHFTILQGSYEVEITFSVDTSNVNYKEYVGLIEVASGRIHSSVGVRFDYLAALEEAQVSRIVVTLPFTIYEEVLHNISFQVHTLQYTVMTVESVLIRKIESP